MDNQVSSEWTSETVREEITRLRERVTELEARCARLQGMNDQLRDALALYLDADNRARRLLDAL
jgi:hypothetical protein